MLSIAYYAGWAGFTLLATSLFWVIQDCFKFGAFILRLRFLLQQLLGSGLVFFYYYFVTDPMPASSGLYVLNFLMALILIVAYLLRDLEFRRARKEIIEEMSKVSTESSDEDIKEDKL
jgi:hypothetical protein